MLAWHFLPSSRCLRWGSRKLVRPGRKMVVDPPLLMCRHGLHGSKNIMDALTYAPGPVLCRVSMLGEVIEEDDKYCATERHCIWMADATRDLHEFACWCAETALANYCRLTDQKPAQAVLDTIAAKRGWLKGSVGDKELLAARLAVRAAPYEPYCLAAHAITDQSLLIVTCEAANMAAHMSAIVAAREAAHQAIYSIAARVAGSLSYQVAFEDDRAAYEAAIAAQEAKLVEMVCQIERHD